MGNGLISSWQLVQGLLYVFLLNTVPSTQHRGRRVCPAGHGVHAPTSSILSPGLCWRPTSLLRCLPPQRACGQGSHLRFQGKQSLERTSYELKTRGGRSRKYRVLLSLYQKVSNRQQCEGLQEVLTSNTARGKGLGVGGWGMEKRTQPAGNPGLWG